jgi:hypothetical protein
MLEVPMSTLDVSSGGLAAALLAVVALGGRARAAVVTEESLAE